MMLNGWHSTIAYLRKMMLNEALKKCLLNNKSIIHAFLLQTLTDIAFHFVKFIYFFNAEMIKKYLHTLFVFKNQEFGHNYPPILSLNWTIRPNAPHKVNQYGFHSVARGTGWKAVSVAAVFLSLLAEFRAREASALFPPFQVPSVGGLALPKTHTCQLNTKRSIYFECFLQPPKSRH